MSEIFDNIPEMEDLPFEEEVEAPEEMGESLESLDEGQQTEEPSPTREEPGYVQKRISRAVSKVEAKYDAIIQGIEAKYAPMVEQLQEMQAQELVRSGKIKDLDIAKDYVRRLNGAPAPAQKQETTNPATQARISMLEHQAEKIQAKGGPDVVAEFKNNERIRQKVVAGEMDFYEVAEYLNEKSKKKPPTPMRSPNGASGQSPNSIMSMSDEQFERMQKKIKEGARYRLK